MLVIAASLVTCSDNNDINKDISVVTVDTGKETAFDKYLKVNYTDTYNIKFLYKWENIEADLNYALVPANYENSIKMANMIKYLCLDAYEKVAPKGFLEKYFPKMIMLIGSPAYRNNGTMVLGTAEGGLKIALYNINNLNVDNVEQLYEFYFRTIYHEFSHILHQTKPYTTDFDKISGKDYVSGNWNSAWDGNKTSLSAGFISDYSSKEPNEDFVELIAHYVTNTAESWAAKIEPAGDEGKAKINQKVGIVKSYLKDLWQIDLDALRAEIQARGAKLSEQNLDNIEIK